MIRYITIFDEMEDDQIAIFNELDGAIDFVYNYYTENYNIGLFQFILSIDELGNTAIVYDRDSMDHYLTFDRVQDERERFYDNVL